MIFLKWEEPVEPNGLITQYEVCAFLLFTALISISLTLSESAEIGSDESAFLPGEISMIHNP